MLGSVPSGHGVADFAAIDINTSDIALLQELRRKYETLRGMRDDVARVYATYDLTTYHEITGHNKTRFHPASLSPADKVPPLAEIFSKKSTIDPPAQRRLSMSISHARWLDLLGATRLHDEPYFTT